MNTTRRIPIGINGFGRIGRQVFKAIKERHFEMLQVVAINDLGSPEANAHLLKYDSAYGRYSEDVSAKKDALVVGGEEVKVMAERDPASLTWRELGARLVIESTGIFTDKKLAEKHITEGGARKVIISAPASNEDLTVVLGVNEKEYNPEEHHVISNASCTTNCVAPMAKVLDDTFGIENALMSTIHSYTNDQRILDQVHGDLRRARSAAVSIIPTTTGAARAVTKVIPHLKGRIDGMAYRVPTITGSVTDLTAQLTRTAAVHDVNEAFKKAAAETMKGILSYSEEALVSVDYIRNPHSCTIDALSTSQSGNYLVKVVGWYDNEWGYASRTADLAAFIVGKGI